MTTQRLKVTLDTGSSYDIRVGTGLLAKLGEHVGAATASPAGRAVVITDSNVGPLYLQQTREALSTAGFEVFDLTVPAGEISKSLEVAGELFDALGLLNIGRDGLIVALGGGMVGDLAAFVASTWLRGISCVQVPTSLLAMVDSAVGGKTAINIKAGKNLVGSFKQPIYVQADLMTLKTLPTAQWDNGLAEVAKSAIIAGGEFYSWLSAEATRLCSHEETIVQAAIVQAMSFKAGVVARDERETGLRECLNYGHTFAHALEAASEFAIPHGRAVAEGIRFAARLAVEAIGAPAEFALQQEALLDALGLAPIEATFSADELYQRMYTDKKVRGGELRFVLASAPGEWQTIAVDPDLVKIYLIYWEESKSK
jgi:3-dehydroquinate synthase